MPFSNKSNQITLEKWLISGLGQGKYKMRLEHLMVSKNKTVLRKMTLDVFENKYIPD